MRVTESVISSSSSSVSTRVGQPAQRRPRACPAGALRRAGRGTSGVVPAATKTGASSQASADAVLLQPVGQLVLALATPPSGSARARPRPPARPPPGRRRAARAAAGRSPRAPASPACAASPATRSRRAALARTAAAAGLFSSWVRPAVSAPRASSCWRWPTICWELRMPKNRPSSRWMAIGNHSRTASPKSLARISTNSRASLMTRDRRGVGLRRVVVRGSSASRRRRRRRWSVRVVSTSSGPTRRLIAMVPDEQHHHQLGRVALGEDACSPAGHLGHPAALGEPAQLVVGERLEQEQRRAARRSSAVRRSAPR